MAFSDVKKTLKYPEGVSRRFKDLDAYDRLLDGTLYDDITKPFDIAFDGGGTYIPIHKRRPSLIYNLARIIAEQCASLTFGEGHSPNIKCEDGGQDSSNAPNPYEPTEKALAAIADTAELPSIMMQAVTRGSVGSCALVVRSLPSGMPHISVVLGKYARPILNPRDPMDVQGLVQQYPVRGYELIQRGYPDSIVEKDDDFYWLRSELDAQKETWYLPLANDKFNVDPKKRVWKVDEERSGPHRFGVVPTVWIRNGSGVDTMDGPATFGAITDMIVSIDYLLSHLDRAIHYAADPLLVIKRGELLDLDLVDGGKKVVKDPANAVDLQGKDSDAKLLETTGKGVETGREFIKAIREYALEVVGGMRSDSDHAGGGPQSGRALELLHQALVWLIERCRLAYGNRGYLPLMKLMLIGIKRGAIVIPGVDVANVDVNAPMHNVWPHWWKPRGQDLAQQASALQTLAGGSTMDPVAVLPREMVTRIAATDLGFDPNQVVADMDKQNTQDEADAAVAAEQAHSQALDLKTATPKPSIPTA
jgi:hypothetical protein